jgi:transcriptional regulator with XRE-family HTH domain
MDTRNSLARLRHARGLTLQQLADEVGCTAPYISRMERGQTPITVRWLPRLAKALDTTEEAITAADTMAPPAQPKKLRPNRIEELRQTAGLTMQQLAEMVGCTSSQISKLEKGSLQLSWEWQRKVADVLEVHPSELRNETSVIARTPEEEEIINIYRGLSSHTQETFRTIVKALEKKEAPKN